VSGETGPLVRAERLEEGRVLRLVLDRPKANVLSRAMMAALAEALTTHRDEPGLRLVILRGAGGNFSFGAAVEEHRPDQAAAMLRDFHAFIRMLAAYPVPVAALVEGRCLGGAFEVALCCHLVFAVPGAVFGCPEIRLGVFPPVLAAAGALRLGGALSERLLLTGAELGAEEASRAGFAVMLAGGGDPEEEVLAWYRQHIAPLSAYSLRQAARAAREGSGLLGALGAPLDAAERLYLERLVPSHDGNEGIEAFMARRAPVWKDS
jgi:cyclohexa-1,5-dienecarbonyl-CoA hydratase